MSFNIDDIPNKMMTAPPSKKEFHFSGEGIWHNLTILAANIEEATQQWLKSRVLINPPQEQSTTASEPPKEESNVE